MQVSALARGPESEAIKCSVTSGPGALGRRTLAEVLGPVPAVGVRRLVLIALQLATELELAHRAGHALPVLRAENVRLDRPGTPFEQAMLPRGQTRAIAGAIHAPPRSRPLASLGRLLTLLLAQKSLYLESSMWTPATGNARVLPRRADAEVLSVLGRVLGCIARRCVGGPRAYASASELVVDLSRLAVATTRLVARRKANVPFVAIHYPKARANLNAARLPRVMLAEPG